MQRKYQKMHVLFEESGSVLSIDLTNNQVINWLFGKSVRTSYQTRDCCLIKFEQADGSMQTYDGYVPDCFPGKHYGDYVEISISKIGVAKINISDKDIDDLLDGVENYDEDDNDDEDDEDDDDDDNNA